jgi:hypothetical protein
MTQTYGMGALPPEHVQRLIAKMAADPLVAGGPWPADPVFQPSGKPLPASVDMRSQCSPIEDQLQYGTCTANSTVGMCELALKRAGRFVAGVDDLSRMFNYWYAGTLDNSAGQDIGRTVRSAIVAAQVYGLCKESTEPYTGQDITQAPSAAAVAEAALRRVPTYAWVPPDPNGDWKVTGQRIKQALADGYPVSLGFKVFRWLFGIHGPINTHAAQPGPLNAGDPQLDWVGNHDVVIVGYQDTGTIGGVTDGYFIVRNSWGTAWGDAGYWGMPYVRINDGFDFWTISGFDGVDLGASAEPPLDPANVAQLQYSLVASGLASGTPGADWSFTPHPALYKVLAAVVFSRAGLSYGHMGQVVGVTEAEVAAFLADPTIKGLFHSWLAALK